MLHRCHARALLPSLVLALAAYGAHGGCSSGHGTSAPTPSRERSASATPRSASAERAAPQAPPAGAAGATAAAETAIEHALRPFAAPSGSGAFHRFRIPLAHANLAFVDLHYQTPLVDALGEQDLVINGGYWAYQGSDRKIQGLLIVEGTLVAPRAHNLSGGILEIRHGKARLLPSDAEITPSGAQLAIQCNPRLVLDGRLIPKLEHVRRAARTALCIREQGRVLDAYLTDEGTRPTLVELAEFLLQEGCDDALNLDGGPSTAAVLRGASENLTVGVGDALPYGIGFRLRR
jgi:hypothetical protein